MQDVVIVSGARTALGTFLGTLKDVPAARLGAECIKASLKRAGLRPEPSKQMLDHAPNALKSQGRIELEQKYDGDWDQSAASVVVDEVIMGNVLQAGQGQNPARQATLYAGLPKETPAATINKVCASGMKAIAMGVQSIRAGDAEVVVAGGMENMSQTPYALPAMREGARMFGTEARDLMVHDGLWELFYGYHMGVTAENIAEAHGIGRQEQDQLGVDSHARAMAAIRDGIVQEEVVPVHIPKRKGDPVVFDTDERPMDTDMEKMGKLKPVFKKDGTVTAGNASGINDAGAAVLLMTREKAESLGLTPLATIASTAAGAIDPAYMGLGVIPAVHSALHKAGWSVKDIERAELNEAFAAQALACLRELGLDWERTNPHGSGISLGHPIGSTGARIVYSLAKEMERSGSSRGLATLCIGGGMGFAATLQRG
jgi:acetyl-CoA C-acetyltransferase